MCFLYVFANYSNFFNFSGRVTYIARNYNFKASPHHRLRSNLTPTSLLPMECTLYHLQRVRSFLRVQRSQLKRSMRRSCFRLFLMSGLLCGNLIIYEITQCTTRKKNPNNTLSESHFLNLIALVMIQLKSLEVDKNTIAPL